MNINLNVRTWSRNARILTVTVTVILGFAALQVYLEWNAHDERLIGVPRIGEPVIAVYEQVEKRVVPSAEPGKLQVTIEQATKQSDSTFIIATVIGEDGNSVFGLNASNFRLFVDGKLQEIAVSYLIERYVISWASLPATKVVDVIVETTDATGRAEGSWPDGIAEIPEPTPDLEVAPVAQVQQTPVRPWWSFPLFMGIVVIVFGAVALASRRRQPQLAEVRHVPDEPPVSIVTESDMDWPDELYPELWGLWERALTLVHSYRADKKVVSIAALSELEGLDEDLAKRIWHLLKNLGWIGGNARPTAKADDIPELLGMEAVAEPPAEVEEPESEELEPDVEELIEINPEIQEAALSYTYFCFMDEKATSVTVEGLAAELGVDGPEAVEVRTWLQREGWIDDENKPVVEKAVTIPSLFGWEPDEAEPETETDIDTEE